MFSELAQTRLTPAETQNGRRRAKSVDLPAVQVPVRIKQLEERNKEWNRNSFDTCWLNEKYVLGGTISKHWINKMAGLVPILSARQKKL